MRSSVVVIALVAACTAPVPQPVDCATYQSCFLDDDGAGYQTLARLLQNNEDPELSCYAGFALADANGTLPTIIDPMRRAYGPDGHCWAGGYSAVTDAPDLDTRYVDACLQHCQTELAAECARSVASKACAQNAAVDAFCADPGNLERIAAADCPDQGEGE